MAINIAYAEGTASTLSTSQTLNQNNLMSFLPFVMIFIVFYFMLIRPQVKKQKEHQNLVSSVKIGDKVVTSSGIIGTIAKIEDDKSMITLEVSPEVKIKMLKSSINDILNKDKNNTADSK